MIRLIASDMDGTLLSSHLSISEKNREAIRIAEDKGIQFMIATGRAYSEAKPALEDAGIECPIITGNGAQVFDKHGNELFTFDIPKKSAWDIMSHLREHKLYFEVMTTRGVYSDHQPQRLENYATLLADSLPHITYKMAIAMAATQLEMQNITYVDSYRELIDDNQLKILKIIAFDEKGPAVLQPASDAIQQVEDIIVTSSFPNNIEINHFRAQKGTAVQIMADNLEIPLERVMTIGDNFNDISMLKIAGVSFAMANAEPEVKQIAKYETDTNLNDGVGRAILRAIEEQL
ncbi:Cof-type HAD-IIB family hydrolase [Vagococcus acidifermentans]|uniref:HAD family hydrolase n=1 Tax=Vagococcus acidifermentans TaxID=564710 RepID=A0A430AUL5_9ENTE|nr:Cof-type HAD-IIB family hydrolase [Vagococcus acidifermentans]RSU11747.1 HAD family hydrolase [Vagococcus acidifermentans]